MLFASDKIPPLNSWVNALRTSIRRHTSSEFLLSCNFSKKFKFFKFYVLKSQGMMIQFRYAEIIHRLERPNQFANPIKTRIRAICGEGCNLRLSFALCTHRTHILPEKHEYSIVCWYILMLRDLPTKQKLLGKYQNHRLFFRPLVTEKLKIFYFFSKVQRSTMLLPHDIIFII